MALVTSQPVIRAMDESDPEVISAAFTALGWHKPPALFRRYLAEQGAVIRIDDEAALMLTRLVG